MFENNSEDFRSVIDDLTIENRRLRKRLQKYEQLHCGNLQSDKLFEIRVHGLPASKKRRLERTLQDFTSSLGDTGDEDPPSTFAQKLSKVSNRRLAPVHASSSSTSNSRPLDSAYASMSASGGNSDARMQKVDAENASCQSSSSDQNVRSYLQSISHGVLPKHPPVMTETAKKRVVVRRLEQLFTGSRDSSNTHSQSRQQQEVSQSAANAERCESEARGHHVGVEGNREAKISSSENQVASRSLPILEKASSDPSSRDTSVSGVATPDQRPTRPLDLDPSRAQDPERNIEYIKHLGFDALKSTLENKSREDEGWVYLNLLIGMAQLHILNVTPDFVRDSIRDISAKFELSPDGSRIRWKGGDGGTKISLGSGDNSEHTSEAYPTELNASRELGRSKSSKPSTEIQSGVSGIVQLSHGPSPGSYNTNFEHQRPLLLGQIISEDPYQYRPIFYHAPLSEEEDTYSFDGKNSQLSSAPIESTSAFDPDGARYGHASQAAAQSRLRRGTDPIIFYNRARFYTDLSKDEESMPYNCPLYDRSTGGVVGCDNGNGQDGYRGESKGLISKPLEPNPISSIEPSASTPSITGLTENFPNSTRSPTTESEAKSFEVSGLGGVMPGDNFSIKVHVAHEQPSEKSGSRTKIISARRTELVPSSLPPPSYAFLPHSSGSASDEDIGDEESDAKMEDADDGDVGQFVPPRFLNTFSSDTTRNESSEDQEDSDDDSSIDLLAHARQIEPEEVAAREREFEENVSISPEKMVATEVDPPESSVVATIGGPEHG